jgi:hypothetical protein
MTNPHNNIQDMLDQMLGQSMKNIEEFGIALNHAIYLRAEIEVPSAKGKSEFEKYPEWVKNLTFKLTDTLFKPAWENIKDFKKLKTSFAHGMLDGMMQRIFQSVVQEFLQCQNAPGKEMKEISFALNQSNKESVNESLVKAFHKIIGTEEIPKKNNGKMDFEKLLEHGSGTIRTLRNTYRMSHQSATDGHYKPDQQARYFEGLSRGFTEIIKTDGWFNHGGERTKIYFLLAANWKEIEEMRTASTSVTTDDLKVRLDEWNGQPLEVENDKFCDPKYFKKICGDLKLQMHKPGRPRKTTK